MTAARPLLVVAVGGNALSSPAAPEDRALAEERLTAMTTGAELALLIARGYRLLVVHGNGPQVGRLLRHDADTAQLDIHVAQTQGELGFLLAAALERHSGEPAVALVTRVEIDADDPHGGDPEKPVGAVLAERPTGPATRTADGLGWRRTVPSPRPRRVLELASITRLLEHAHVVAGGGGGVPVSADGQSVAGVIDKDRVAALLAIDLEARALLIGTDVPGAYRDYGKPDQRLIAAMSVDDSRGLLASGAFAAGSMGPKVASAADFVAATGRAAVICQLGDLARALDGGCGTTIGR
ncbi:MAG: carbamate kinase [Pseudomonadales bacterium]